MHAHPPPPRERYALRNDPAQTFALRSEAEAAPAGGAVVRVAVLPRGAAAFRCEVVFGGTFVATKQNFDLDMFHDTALALVRSQLESRVYRDTRMTLNQNSGLPQTEVGVSFDWSLEVPQ